MSKPVAEASEPSRGQRRWHVAAATLTADWRVRRSSQLAARFRMHLCATTCAALIIMATTLMTPAAASASAPSLSISVAPSSSVYTRTDVEINVSGDAPSDGFLAVFIGAKGAEPEELTRGPEAVGAGSFAKTFTVLAAKAGEYTVTAYLYSNEAREETLAASEAQFDASRPTASLSITPTPANILVGRPVELTVTGSSAVAATLEGETYEACLLGERAVNRSYGEGEEECDRGTGTQVGPGAFTLHLNYVPSDNGPDTIRFSIWRTLQPLPEGARGEQEVLGGAEVTLPRAPLPAAELESPAEAWTTTPGTAMSFSWSAAPFGAGEPPFGEDTLVIKSAKSNDEEEYLVTEKGFKYMEREPKWLPLSRLGTWTTDQTTSVTTAKLKAGMSLFPGEYVWQVKRTSGAETATSAQQRFVVTTPTVKLLRVKPRTHRGATSGHPGYTDFSVTATPYVSVTVKLTHHGHTSTETWGSRSGSKPLTPTVIRWTCRHPAGAYKYVVTARGGSGSKITRRGRFSTITAAQCASMKLREASERAARREREERTADREQRQATERFEGNCKAIGGKPVIVYTSEGAEVVCRNPLGGVLPVPM